MSTQRPSWLDLDLYPFFGATAEVAGHTLHWVDEGAGPTLLFLHGNPTWSFVWRGVIERLSARYRCLAPDLPGFGLSSAPEGWSGSPSEIAEILEAWVRRLDLREVILVAQDWGGPIGLRLVEQMPERFSAVVLGNTWAWPITGDRHFERFSATMGGPLGAWLTRRLNLFVNLMIPMGHRRRRVTRREMAHYRHALSTAQRRQASAVLPRAIVEAAPFLAAVEAGLSAVRRLPVLLIWADRDMAFRASELQRWCVELPEATVVPIRGAGHFLQSDAPQEFAEAMTEWLGDGSRLGAAVARQEVADD